MKIAFFSTKPYDKKYFDQANAEGKHEIKYLEVHLNEQTVKLAAGCQAVCVFVNDTLNKKVLSQLSDEGIKLIALRCAGFNNVDIKEAEKQGLQVARVPAYSPHGVAEHTVALILSLNRKIYRAYHRVRDGNLSLEGLLGFELNGKTVGVIGTGRIGTIVCGILKGFGCQILAYDPFENEECRELGVQYVPIKEVFENSDIITLHTPLLRETHHIINKQAIAKMKNGVMLINTSRGGLIDTKAVIAGLKSGKIAYLGLDVYEEEADLFFEDLSGQLIQDDVFARLLTFPNVVITGHQAFFTETALINIAKTTLSNARDFEGKGIPKENCVTSEFLKK